jgi:hypothetical protein
MSRIQTLPARVSQEEAEKIFNGGGVGSRLRRVHLGPIRSLALVYIPYHLFQVRIENAGKQEERILGIDAVHGTLDAFSFDEVPHSSQFHNVETRNVIPPHLSIEDAGRLVRSKVERVLFQTGFFKMRRLGIQPEWMQLQFHVPYWVGFFGEGEIARISVVDGVRRTVEGAKVRALIETWLRGSYD